MFSISEKEFGSVSGRTARLFTIDNGYIRAAFTDYGCTLTDLYIPDRNGVLRNVVLGYNDAELYSRGTSYLGAVVGRYAGRIRSAEFSLDGEEYKLERNDAGGHLHGGFSKRFYESESVSGGLCFRLSSPHMDEGFPGRLEISVTAELVDRSLRLTYEAETDRPTVINLTNHSYFNLAGGGDVKAHALRVFSDSYAEIDELMLPTGRLNNTAGTPLNFGTSHLIGDALSDPRLAPFGGMDHSFCLPWDGELNIAAELYCERTGILMRCNTTQPSLHIYTGNFLNADAANSFPKHGGICFEAQHLPDSPNIPYFPSTALMPGERYRQVTEFEFSVTESCAE